MPRKTVRWADAVDDSSPSGHLACVAGNRKSSLTRWCYKATYSRVNIGSDNRLVPTVQWRLIVNKTHWHIAKGSLFHRKYSPYHLSQNVWNLHIQIKYTAVSPVANFVKRLNLSLFKCLPSHLWSRKLQHNNAAQGHVLLACANFL